MEGILKGKYHCTVDLLFDWFWISCMTIDNFCFYLQNRLSQTSQTGGQWYSDTSPFSIPWHKYGIIWCRFKIDYQYSLLKSMVDKRKKIQILKQGILKGEVSLYGWPPVWLVWNQLYDNWQFLFLFLKQTNAHQSNRRSMVQWYFPL